MTDRHTELRLQWQDLNLDISHYRGMVSRLRNELDDKIRQLAFEYGQDIEKFDALARAAAKKRDILATLVNQEAVKLLK